MRRRNYRHLKDCYRFKWTNFSPHLSTRRVEGKYKHLWRKFLWPMVRWVQKKNKRA